MNPSLLSNSTQCLLVCCCEEKLLFAFISCLLPSSSYYSSLLLEHQKANFRCSAIDEQQCFLAVFRRNIYAFRSLSKPVLILTKLKKSLQILNFHSGEIQKIIFSVFFVCVFNFSQKFSSNFHFLLRSYLIGILR